MRWLAVVLVAGVAAADPSVTPVRKAAPTGDKYIKAAGEAFAKARAADEAGNLEEALRYYEKAQAIAPHPNTLYNMADVERRLNRIGRAIDLYRKYLAADPKAADRAIVEKLIAGLDKMPGTLEIEVEESDAQLFVDGAPSKGGKLQLPHGDHVVDAITPITAGSERCNVQPGTGVSKCKIRLAPRIDGNVFLSGPPHLDRSSNSIDHFHYEIKNRFKLEPGHHEWNLMRYGSRQCTPLAIDVPAGDVVLYVWIDGPEHSPDGRGECAKVTSRSRVLKF
jgi:tetratricopeptide (TPR) repeat protein